jgi:hypothetical protein
MEYGTDITIKDGRVTLTFIDVWMEVKYGMTKYYPQTRETPEEPSYPEISDIDIKECHGVLLSSDGLDDYEITDKKAIDNFVQFYIDDLNETIDEDDGLYDAIEENNQRGQEDYLYDKAEERAYEKERWTEMDDMRTWV